MDSGWIYIAKNSEDINELYKVGKTTDPQQRKQSLNTSGVVGKIKFEELYKVDDNLSDIEKSIHKSLEKKGIFTETSAQKLFKDKQIKLSILIKPIYKKKGFITLFKKEDINKVIEYKKNLKKHITEMDIRRMGLKNISRYRKLKLIVPDSEYYQNTFIGNKKKAKPLYLKETVQKFLDENKITILNNKNYLTRKELERKVGFTIVRKLIKFGIILEAGIGITEGGFNKLYEKKQIQVAHRAIKIAKKLGFTRNNKIYVSDQNYKKIKRHLNLQ